MTATLLQAIFADIPLGLQRRYWAPKRDDSIIRVGLITFEVTQPI